MLASTLAPALAALALFSSARAHSPPTLLHHSPRFEIVRREHLNTTTTTTSSVDSSLGGVCTPSECIQGQTSLKAGVVVNTPVNSTSRNTILLPGTYTTKTAASASGNSSLLSFSSSSTSSPYAGFSSSGSTTSSLTVALQAGLVAYPSPLYEGDASFTALSTNASASANSSKVESLLLSDNMWAVLSVDGARVVVWDSVPDVGEISGGSGGVYVREMQSSTCATACASGGSCVGNGTCACEAGWTGTTCNACAAGYFGTSCSACPSGCTDCDDGLTGSGLCLDAANVTTASSCNCINGVCASDAADATCSCNAGWYTASNGTQCAACAAGYYMTSAGDCRACDASCAECSSPNGVCLTCQDGLAASSSSSTDCVTATTATANGTFITCPSRTFWNSGNQTCTACNSLCETCWGDASDQCLTCRTPYVVMQGQCVAYSSSTGVCDSDGVVQGNGTSGQIAGSNAGWVYDNDKAECDALPAKCTAGSISSFSSSSTWSDVSCTACLAGSWLSDGDCVSSCPTGSVGLSDSTSCQTCDSSCATCSLSTTYCASCASGQYLLNGTCTSSCSTGFFASSNSTCEACHPDCASCSGSSDTCTSCPSDRPVLTSSSTCVQTCSSDQYYDNSSGSCQSCDSSCATCSGSGSDSCLSCSGSTTVLSGGECVATSDGCGVVSGFGVCLSDLVTVDAKESSSSSSGKTIKIKWREVLLIILAILLLIGLVVWRWRKKEQERRRKHTKRFGDGLDKKEVDFRLKQMPAHVAYPKAPSILKSPSTPSYNVPLTPRLPTHNPNRDFRVIAPTTTNNNNFVLDSPPTPSDHGRDAPAARDVKSGAEPGSSSTIWSVSSAGASQSRFMRSRPELEMSVPRLQPAPPPRRLVAQGTGMTGMSGLSGVSGYSTTPEAFRGGPGTYVGGKREWGTNNPFR